jgi:hypothetical protein
MPLRLVFPNGAEKRANEITAGLLASAQADARKAGAPRAAAICRIVMQAFPVISYGQMKAVQIGRRRGSLRYAEFQEPQGFVFFRGGSPVPRSRGDSKKESEAAPPFAEADTGK